MRFNICDSLIGHNIDKAKEIAGWEGYKVRLARVGDMIYVGTDDFQQDRINVEIDFEKVTKAYFG